MTAPIACILGYPVKQSRSPLIHRHWLQRWGPAGDYVMAEVAPENLAAFVRDIRRRAMLAATPHPPQGSTAASGASPHAPAADAVGAANTIWFEKGNPVATTRISRVLKSLDHGAPGWDSHAGTALVQVGRAEASRAIVYGLLQARVRACFLWPTGPCGCRSAPGFIRRSCDGCCIGTRRKGRWPTGSAGQQHVPRHEGQPELALSAARPSSPRRRPPMRISSPRNRASRQGRAFAACDRWSGLGCCSISRAGFERWFRSAARGDR